MTAAQPVSNQSRCGLGWNSGRAEQVTQIYDRQLYKFTTEEIVGAKSFNFAPKFPLRSEFSDPKAKKCMFGRKLSDDDIFPTAGYNWGIATYLGKGSRLSIGVVGIASAPAIALVHFITVG